MTEEPRPAELYLLRGSNGMFVRAVDDPPGAECFLACFSEKDAKLTAQDQLDRYEIKCEPEQILIL